MVPGSLQAPYVCQVTPYYSFLDKKREPRKAMFGGGPLAGLAYV